jgi:hypothetical protein
MGRRPKGPTAILNRAPLALKTADISFLTPLLLSEPPLKTADISFLTPLLLSGPG